MIKPKRLKKGGTIAIISPASPSFSPSEMLRSVEMLEKLNYKVKLAPNVNKTKGFTAASEEDRVADFNAMFRDDSIDAVFVTQGGYGSAQMIRHIDFDVVKNNPKIFEGYSDITSLHLAIQKFAGVVTFHGPGASRFSTECMTPYTLRGIMEAITESDPIGDITLASEKKWLYPIVPGVAEAPLTGGNLTLICASLGTPFEIDTRGKILMIEEVDAEPWIVDNSLSHLRNAGKFDDIAGLVIAECAGCEPFMHNPGYHVDTSLEDVLLYYFDKLKVPVLYGLPLGHTEDMATLPLGVNVRLDADNKKLTVTEGAVV